MTDPLRHAWQTSAADAPLPSLDEVRAGADRFHRIVRRRNAIEYAASALVVLIFGAMALFAPAIATRIGSALVVAGVLTAAWQLRRRASAVAPPDAEGALPILAHQRAQLVRQRDALAKIGRWYLGPLVPGMIAILFAPVFTHGPAALLAMNAGHIIGVTAFALVFGGTWWLNRRTARMLQRAIDDLDALAIEP